MKTVEINEEVLYVTDDIVEVTADDIAWLKQKASSNARKRIRICAHRDVVDRSHEMLIVHTKGVYTRPQKHLTTAESFHVVEGVADVVIFTDTGDIERVVPMGEYGSGRALFCRIDRPLFHSLIVRSDYFVFKETKNGPYRPEESVFASWSPEEGHVEAVREFMVRLRKAVDGRTIR